MPGFSNILLIQLGDIGDVVLTTPTIRAVKETYPEARVSVMVRQPFGSLLVADPNLHEVVEAAKVRGTLLHKLSEYLLFARRLRRTHYDLVINLRTGDRGAILTSFTGAQVRVGLYEKNKPFWYKHLFTKLLIEPPYVPLPVHPGADQSLRIVRAMGINTGDSVPKLYVAPKDHDRAVELVTQCGLSPIQRWVTINPCSRWKYKEWSYAKWGDVVDHLWQSYHLATVLIGSSEEIIACQEIAAGRESHVFNLAGKTSLGELAALLQLSSLHLGVDSAAPHITAAVGIPTVTIFGPGNWKGWTVVDDLHRVVTANIPCVPCGRKGCDDTEKSRCLDELESSSVLEEIYSVLKMMKIQNQTH